MSWPAVAGAVAALAVAAALIVWRSQVRALAQASAVFLGEVKTEVQKVTWPDKQQLKNATAVIIVFVIVVAMIIGLMDVVLQWIFIKALPQWLG